MKICGFRPPSQRGKHAIASTYVVMVLLEAKSHMWAKNADSECFYLGPRERAGSLGDGYDFMASLFGSKGLSNVCSWL